MHLRLTTYSALKVLELAQVPRVPSTHVIFGQYCLAPADFGNFNT